MPVVSGQQQKIVCMTCVVGLAICSESDFICFFYLSICIAVIVCCALTLLNEFDVIQFNG